MFGGEVMPVKQLNYWKKYLPNLKTIANVYGPTEATVNCTYYIVDREFGDSEVLPLGKACENTGLLVLDEDNRVIDSSQVNELGELCVYGSSLSAGYWDDEEKTNEKYVDNPINKGYREKMYLTGDLVYYNERGELVFAGRKDFQIKHSGYRIELGEIEAAAMGRKEISVVCAAYHNEKKQIVLFYQGDIAQDDLKEHLLTIIPKYMVPTIYYQLNRFPYNDNGKIDRKKLQADYL
jgi:acyl-coenzyme A synthetase/AMP-(fatty) acid ligase